MAHPECPGTRPLPPHQHKVYGWSTSGSGKTRGLCVQRNRRSIVVESYQGSFLARSATAPIGDSADPSSESFESRIVAHWIWVLSQRRVFPAAPPAGRSALDGAHVRHQPFSSNSVGSSPHNNPPRNPWGPKAIRRMNHCPCGRILASTTPASHGESVRCDRASQRSER